MNQLREVLDKICTRAARASSKQSPLQSNEPASWEAGGNLRPGERWQLNLLTIQHSQLTHS